MLLTGATIAGGRGRTGYGTGADDADDRRLYGHVRAGARSPRQADPVDSRADAPRLRLHRQRRRVHPTRGPRRRDSLRRGRAVPLRRQQRPASATTATSSGASSSSLPASDFVALSDQDDVWHADKLETLRGAFHSERVQLAYADMAIVSSDGRLLAPSYWTDRANNHTDLASLLLINTVTGAASLFRHELLDVALPFPDVPGKPFHDHWLACVALALGEVEFVDRPLHDYVQHGDNVVGRHEPFPRELRGGLRQRSRAIRPQPTATTPQHHRLGAPLLRGRGRRTRSLRACFARAPERSPRSRGGIGNRQGGRHELLDPLAPLAPRQERTRRSRRQPHTRNREPAHQGDPVASPAPWSGSHARTEHDARARSLDVVQDRRGGNLARVRGADCPQCPRLPRDCRRRRFRASALRPRPRVRASARDIGELLLAARVVRDCRGAPPSR